MKLIKKAVCLVLTIALLTALCAALLGCSNTPREEILKLYLPEGYIEEDIFGTFESWYKEQTGKNVTVQLETFETVEQIQLAVERNKTDYDVICPSDYMVEYLISKNLLQKIDKTKVDIAKEGFFKPEYIETTRQFDPTLEYSVPYMYGTLGLVYDYNKTGKHLDSWEALYGSEFAGRRSVKKSMRDAYAIACLYNARSETAGLTGNDLKLKVQSIFEDVSDSTISSVKSLYDSVKKGGSEWDVDNIKYEMAANTTNVAVGLMWSCDAGYVMNTYEDDDGVEHPGNRNLWYVVPKEGGNVYIDNMVISTYAGNTEAAQYFLQFLCQKDIAVQNSFYAGAISPVAAAYDELYDYYVTDEEGIFEGTAEGWKEMFLETMFPSTETLNRCGVMKDFGNGQSAVTRMWGNVVG